MRRNSTRSYRWAIRLAGIFLLAVLTGCQTAPDTAAFKTLTATQMTVEQALGLWDTYLVARSAQNNPVPIATELRVKRAYEQYQKAALVLADAGRAWTNARGLPTVPGGNSEASTKALYELALEHWARSKADLFALLESLGVALVSPATSTP